MTPPAAGGQRQPARHGGVRRSGRPDRRAAEIAKNEKEKQRLRGLIAAKEKKLANESFVDRAPADVVQKEHDALADLHQQLQAVETFLRQLRGNGERDGNGSAPSA